VVGVGAGRKTVWRGLVLPDKMQNVCLVTLTFSLKNNEYVYLLSARISQILDGE
jgi:hypothetical protein